MKVLVTGGTGFVGRHITARLAREGHAIRLLSRHANSDSARQASERFNAETFRGDIADPESLDPACAGMAAIIHLVGIISEVGENTFEKAHVIGTRNILEAARRAGIGRFIHISALGTRLDAVSRYHQTKWRAEELVRASGLPYTIFRPSIIYGAGDGFVSLFARVSRFSPVLPVIGAGCGKMRPVPVEAVAEAVVKALSEPAAAGETFVLAGPEELTFVEVLDAILDEAGRRRFKIHVPVALARSGAAIMEFLFGRILRMAPPLTRDQIQMLQEDNTGDPVPAAELFGLQMPSFREGLAARP
jgi:uncharacterized protein YbjT (DUF2867 family)